MASVTEELTSKFQLILMTLNLRSHMWLVAPLWDNTFPDLFRLGISKSYNNTDHNIVKIPSDRYFFFHVRASHMNP